MTFSKPGNAERLWGQLQIEDYWGHHDRPPGQRFLGSIGIPKTQVEDLLNTIRSSFTYIRPFTFTLVVQKTPETLIG